ncbi:hypothetical protein BH23ACI1_BH23ACI1_14130 [soil metagenome]
MNLPLGRAIAAGALGGMAGALFLALFYGFNPVLRIDFDHDVPRLLVRGIHPPERDRESGLTFVWTQGDMALRLPGLDRSAEWVMDLRLRAPRPDPADRPDLAFFADGVLLMTRAAPHDFEQVQVTIPARPQQRRGGLISMQVSSTFVPGPEDTRSLGVQVDSIALTPASIVLPPRRAFAGAAGAGAIMGVAMALIGVITMTAVGAATLVGAGAAAQIARGFAPHTDFPTDMVTAALSIAIALVAGVWTTERVRRGALRNTARFAVTFSACALFFKLLVILHPNMPVGDAMFHAHRFQGVLAGTIYFTSIAPGNYLFPYAPGMYLFTAPLAGAVTRGASDMALLRIVVLSVDTLAALALYFMAARRWNDRTAGAIAVALYHLIPLEFRVITVGNLTNAFAQSLSIVALALMVSSRVRLDALVGTALLTGVLTAAFASHTSTFPLLFLAATLAGLLYYLRGGPRLRSSAFAVLLAAAGAFILAIVLYYAHFGETYRAEFARISAETTTAAPDAGGRGIGDRFAIVPYYLSTYFGWPALLLAGFGAWRLWRSGARDRLTLALAGWSLSCLLFMLIGILTPVDMRYYLAAIPALALAGGFAASRLWTELGHRRGIAAVLLAWLLRLGLLSWWRTF